MRWQRTLRREQVAKALTDTAVAEYHMMQFDARGRQTVDVQCVLFRGDSSKKFLREFPDRMRARAVSSAADLAATQQWPYVPTIFCGQMVEDMAKIVCNFNGEGIECTDVIADEMDQRPAAASVLSASRSGNCIYVGGGHGTSLPPLGGSTPPGSSSDGGTLSYTPPYGFGGGTLPGGSYEYTPPSGVNCMLGGCGNGGGEQCYETDRPAPVAATTECPGNPADVPDASGLPDVAIDDDEPTFDCVPITKCPTPTEIVNSPAVLLAAGQLMALSLAAKTEFGAWIFKNSDGSLRVGPPIQGDSVSVPLMNVQSQPPDAVGSIHTHWKDGADQNGPSGCPRWYSENYALCGDYNWAIATKAYVVVAAKRYLYLVSPFGVPLGRRAR